MICQDRGITKRNSYVDESGRQGAIEVAVEDARATMLPHVAGADIEPSIGMLHHKLTIKQ